MSVAPTQTWHEANQIYLSAVLAGVRHRLEQHSLDRAAEAREWQVQLLAKPWPDMMPPAALDVLCSVFALSAFERDVLLLCAGMELDARFASLCAIAQGDSSRPYPTFSLVLDALPEADWGALTPEAPLRRWKLIEIGTGSGFVFSPLRIDEWTLHYLAGTSHLDERLTGIVAPLRSTGMLVPSHQALANRITSAWNRCQGTTVVQLCGGGHEVKRAVVMEAAARVGARVFVLNAELIPAAPADLDTLITLWNREAHLTNAVLLIECDRLEETDTARANSLASMIQRVTGLLILSGREQRRVQHRHSLQLEVHKPDASEQKLLWRSFITEAGAYGDEVDAPIEELVSQFDLHTAAIHSVGAQWDGRPESLWDACRVQARPSMSDLAQRVDSPACWDDLVLPESQMQMLREIAAQVRQRATVYEKWGLGTRSTRGLGISALFAGTSGTGKTLAAEVLANELRLDLYRIDLSSIVSKYIGETEKNLRRVFDAAEDGGAVLLFDEADALFGKRSEVNDSHDRYANIEVSYLLQRMEAYRGLAILTTNMKSALDQAFLRRIRFVVQFPFPDAQMRAEIWRRIYGPAAPTEELDVSQLARLQVSGGNIRNIALNAAFLAADEGKKIGMPHLYRAAQNEYIKLEKALTEIRMGGASDAAAKH